MPTTATNTRTITAALVSHSPSLGGAERMLLNLALLLRRSPTVEPLLLIPGPGELADAASANGLSHEFIPALPWYVYGDADLAGYRDRVASTTEVLKRILIERVSDVVVLNTLTNVPPALAAVNLGLPFVVWVHGILDSFLIEGRSSDFSVTHDQLLLQSACGAVANSAWTRRFYCEMLGFQQLEVIPNWTQVDAVAATNGQGYRSKRFACLNHFDHSKGHATLLEAAAVLKSRNLAFRIDLYGQGPVRDAMQQYAKSLGLRGHVQFHGRTAEVTRVYDQSLCLINPSHLESFGMTLIEAMARKRPVIATRAGGPAEIIEDGVTGFLVECGDAEAMAQRMEDLLKDPALATAMGQRGFARVQSRFSPDAAEQSFVRLIQDTVERFEGYDRSTQVLANVYDLFVKSNGAPAAERVQRPTFARQLLAKQRERRGLLSRLRLARPVARLTRGLMRRLRGMAARALRTAGWMPTHADPPAESGPRGIGQKRATASPPAPPRGAVFVPKRIAYRLAPAGPNWNGIDVLIGTHRRPARGRLTLRVLSPGGRVLRRCVADLARARDNDWLSFRFPPVLNSDGVPFELKFRISEARPQTRLSFYEANPTENRLRRALRRAGVPLRGNSLYCRMYYVP